jgi:hypothetical protein
MPKTKTIPRFSVGDEVRVCSGVSDPDYDDLTMGGWAGTIAEVQNGTPPTLFVRWSKQTLKKQSSIYRKRCERDGFDGNEMWLAEGDLEPDIGGHVTIEQPNNVVTRPLSMSVQDDRIRAVFELTSDDPLPEASDELLVAYYKYLATNLSFPFEAKYSFETGPFESKTFSITIFDLLDPDDFPGDEYGLFCQARRDSERIELPLTEVEVGKGNPNRRLVHDYSYWFVNW